MQVREIMKKKLELIKPEDTLQYAAELMKTKDIGALPVVDGNQGVGFLTDRDLAIRGLAAGLEPGAKVSQVMSKTLVTCHENIALEEALKLMCDSDVRRLLVVDNGNHPIGIVTLADIAEQRGQQNELLRSTISDLKHHEHH